MGLLWHHPFPRTLIGWPVEGSGLLLQQSENVGGPKGRECKRRRRRWGGGFSRKDWCWGKPALRSAHTLSHMHINTLSTRVLSPHTPKLLNGQEKHWLWLTLQAVTAGQDRTGLREDVEDEWTPNSKFIRLCFTLEQQLNCCHLRWSRAPASSLETPTLSPPKKKKNEQGKAARTEARASVASLSQRLSWTSSQCPHENRQKPARGLGWKMAQRVGGEGSPKKTSLNLVAGFYHYLRGKWGSVSAQQPALLRKLGRESGVESSCILHVS